MTGRLHGGETGLQALANHQGVARCAQFHSAASTGAEHHPGGFDRCLAGPVRVQERPMNANRRVVPTARHQRHHGGPDATRGMLQRRVVAQRGRRRETKAAPFEIGLDGGLSRRDRGLPDRHRGGRARGVVTVRLSQDRRTHRTTNQRRPSIALAAPYAERLERRDHLLLFATGVAMHQHPVVVGVADRQAGRAVIVGRAARHPANARAPGAECPGDGFSRHRAPRLCPCGKACRDRSPEPAGRPATI